MFSREKPKLEKHLSSCKGLRMSMISTKYDKTVGKNRPFSDLQSPLVTVTKGFNLYNLSLDMKLNIPKCQSSITLLHLCVLL